MMAEAVDAETAFAEDMLAEGVPGLSVADTRRYLEYVADQRRVRLGLPKRFGATNPFGFMELSTFPSWPTSSSGRFRPTRLASMAQSRSMQDF